MKWETQQKAHHMFRTIIGTALRPLVKVKVEGEKYIPSKGIPFIVASNHIAGIDPFILAIFLGLPPYERYVYFGAKKELWHLRWYLGGPILGWLLSLAGQVQVDRSGLKANKSLDGANRVLTRGEAFGIYPEGSRSPDGKLYKGKTGVARIGFATPEGIWVLPSAISGSQFVKPWRVTTVTLRFGEMIFIPHDSVPTHDQMRAETRLIMESIQELSGQETIDAYIKSRHEH